MLGALSAMRLQRNHLRLFVDGKYGWLYVHGVRVSEARTERPLAWIDLGQEHVQSHEGRVAVTTGYFNESERPGAVTSFEDFSDYTL